MDILDNKAEGDRVKGRVTRKIKGGLLVDIGVPVFLPASQIDLRRASDVNDYIGEEIEAEIIKIDAERKNIVISAAASSKTSVASTAKSWSAARNRRPARRYRQEHHRLRCVHRPGRPGRLAAHHRHVWGRVNHPSEVVKLNQKIEVVVLDYDAERNRISLGLKQKTRNPWEDIELRYPPNTGP